MSFVALLGASSASAFLGPSAYVPSRPAVLRHVEPVAVTRPESLPARMLGLAAAVAVSWSSVQPALAGNPIQDALAKKAAEIEANIQKTDFQERNAKFQQDLANAADTTKTIVETTKDAIESGDALDAVQSVTTAPLANTARSVRGAAGDGSIKAGLDGFNQKYGVESLEEAKRRIAKFKAAADKEKEKALAASQADAEAQQARAAQVAAAAAEAAKAAAADAAKAAAEDKALKVLQEDTAVLSERTKGGVARLQETDLQEVQAKTKEALAAKASRLPRVLPHPHMACKPSLLSCPARLGRLAARRPR